MTQQQAEINKEQEYMESINFNSKVWSTLSAIDVNEYVSKKMNLSYLSWAWAWGVLMKHYPNSSYHFNEPQYLDDRTCEIWCSLTISDGVNSLVRTMWLPVMDHKNNAVKEPNARQINDTRMRCLTKCMAMFGLGHYIYAGEDLPEDAEKAKAQQMSEAERLKAHNEALKVELHSIVALKEALMNDNYSTAKETWNEIPDENKKALWVAPTKGGILTTEERAKMQSNEWSQA